MTAILAMMPPAPAATPIRRHRWQRDAVIVLAARHGASAAFLAEAFDLDPSTVRKILRARGIQPRRLRAAQP